MSDAESLVSARPHQVVHSIAGRRQRVLVTGGAGFIGSHTCVALIERGHTPVIADTFANSSPVVVERIQRLTGAGVEVHRVDVRDADALRGILARGIDSVVHFAALKAVGESVERPLDYYDLNVGGTVTLLQAMGDTGVRNLVFSGSCSIFGSTGGGPLPEGAPIGPTNPYSRTKAFCEQVIEDNCATDGTLSATSLRYFNPIGAHPSGELGEDPLGVPNNLLPFAMQVVVGRRDVLRIFGDDYPTPDGTCIRDYIHVVDLARAHVSALAAHRDQAGFRALNLGTGEGTSVTALIAQVREVTGHPVPTRIVARRSGDVPVLIADPTRAVESLVWRCEYDVAAMVEHAWRFQRANPMGYECPARDGFEILRPLDDQPLS